MLEKLFKNYALMMPTTAIYQLNGYNVFGGTRQEFDEFKKWFEKEQYQQVQIKGFGLDMWIRYNDMIIDAIGYSIQHLFRQWKEKPPSKESFTMTTYAYKKQAK